MGEQLFCCHAGYRDDQIAQGKLEYLSLYGRAAFHGEGPTRCSRRSFVFCPVSHKRVPPRDQRKAQNNAAAAFLSYY